MWKGGPRFVQRAVRNWGKNGDDIGSSEDLKRIRGDSPVVSQICLSRLHFLLRVHFPSA